MLQLPVCVSLPSSLLDSGCFSTSGGVVDCPVCILHELLSFMQTSTVLSICTLGDLAPFSSTQKPPSAELQRHSTLAPRMLPSGPANSNTTNTWNSIAAGSRSSRPIFINSWLRSGVLTSKLAYISTVHSSSPRQFNSTAIPSAPVLISHEQLIVMFWVAVTPDATRSKLSTSGAVPVKVSFAHWSHNDNHCEYMILLSFNNSTC